MKTLIMTIFFIPIPLTSSFLINLQHHYSPLHRPRPRPRPLFSTTTTLPYGDATLSSQTFHELYSTTNTTTSSSTTSIPTWLLTRLTDLNYTHPTLLQHRALPTILSGHDTILQAQTGSGKTLAYLLPLLSIIDPSRSAIQALIIVPTRELGLQVSRVARRLAAPRRDITIMSILQGSQNRRQRAWAWAEPPRVAIGTPSEMERMLKHGGLKYNAVKMVVVDEVDACCLVSSPTSTGGSETTKSEALPLHTILSKYLSPTFSDETDAVDETDIVTMSASSLSSSRNKGLQPSMFQNHRQTVFASATIPQHHHFIKKCLQNRWMTTTQEGEEPVHVHVSPSEFIPPTLRHRYVVCKDLKSKLNGLKRVLRNETKLLRRVLIFCEEQRPMEEMARVVERDLSGGGDGGEDVMCGVLRMESSLNERADAMEMFRGRKGLSDVVIDHIVFGEETDGEQSENDTMEPVMNQNHDDDNDQKGPIRILFSTDLAARGLDVTEISHVIHFDLPKDGDTYVHRAGRAGRLGRSGTVLSLITPGQEFVLERLANKLNLNIKCVARQSGGGAGNKQKRRL